MVDAGEPLLELLLHLKRCDYRFTSVTPATHAIVLQRPAPAAPGLRDIFGWNRPFHRTDLDGHLLALLEACDGLEHCNGQLRSRYRVATVGDDLFLHSSFPTASADAVFFGPDTYRFVRFVEEQLGARSSPTKIVDMGARSSPTKIVDMGAGSGAGGIVAAKSTRGAQLLLVDVNPRALSLARVNAAAAGVTAGFLQSDRVPPADLILANPPYMIDAAGRTYRDGGDLFGGALAYEWARQAVAQLPASGTLLLYTGAAVVDGGMPLADALRSLDARVTIEDIDPDVFGEELAQPAYREIERIAAIGAVITKA